MQIISTRFRWPFLLILASIFLSLKLYLFRDFFHPLAPGDELIIKEISTVFFSESGPVKVLAYGNPLLPLIGVFGIQSNHFNLFWNVFSCGLFYFLPLLIFKSSIQKKLNTSNEQSLAVYLCYVLAPINYYTHTFLVEILLSILFFLIIVFSDFVKSRKEIFVWIGILTIGILLKATGYIFLVSFFLTSLLFKKYRRNSAFVILGVITFFIAKLLLTKFHAPAGGSFGAGIYSKIFNEMLSPRLYINNFGKVLDYSLAHISYILSFYGIFFISFFNIFKKEHREDSFQRLSVFLLINTILLVTFTIGFTIAVGVLLGDGETYRLHSRYYFYSLHALILLSFCRSSLNCAIPRLLKIIGSSVILVSAGVMIFFIKSEFRAFSFIDNPDLLWFFNPTWYISIYHKKPFILDNSIICALISSWAIFQALMINCFHIKNIRTLLIVGTLLFFSCMSFLDYKFLKANAKGLQKLYQPCVSQIVEQLKRTGAKELNLISDDPNVFFRLKYELLNIVIVPVNKISPTSPVPNSGLVVDLVHFNQIGILGCKVMHGEK